MNILLVNDDGINAPGLSILYDAVCDLGNITVVAPDGERSAISHSITLDKPMPVKSYKNGKFEGMAVCGTPADCVKLALTEIMDERPDLVISGINLGCNTGLNVIYSGTVGGAAEAVFNGIPGIAVSLATYKNPNWGPVARFIHDMVKTIQEKGMPEGILLNVNVPNVINPNDIAGVKISEQGMAHWQETFDKRVDPKGRTYYWMSGMKKERVESETIDDTVIKSNYISVTPIQFNLTAYNKIKSIKALGLNYQGKQ
ncbi:MAG: 5'/3'-nucleotidase SurE [Candidatus Marinimicrobia bacterium]|nr:5'/3'-nucleotidase SurE [Candidatus Neomarinimicrobiota bacterium]